MLGPQTRAPQSMSPVPCIPSAAQNPVSPTGTFIIWPVSRGPLQAPVLGRGVQGNSTSVIGPESLIPLSSTILNQRNGENKGPPCRDAAGRGPSLAPGRWRTQRQDRGRLGICRAPQLVPAPAHLHTGFPLAVVCPALMAEVARKNVAGLLGPNPEFQ